MKFAIVLIVALLLAGCAQATPVAPATPEPEPVATAELEGMYYWVSANWSDPFYEPGLKGMADAAAELGVKWETAGPTDINMAEYYKALEQLTAAPDTKGLFIYPGDPALGEPLILAAEAKGIPVVIGAADSPFKGRSSFIGYDNTILGQQAGDWACKLIDGKGTVGTMGLVGSGPNIAQRVAGFEAQIAAACPEVKVVPMGQHDGSAENAVKQLDAYLVANPDLALLWWADGLAGQMAQPWKERQQAGAKTLFLATDMPPAALEAVRDGVFVGSVGQDTYTEEYWGLKILVDAAHGKRVPDTLYLAAILVDKANVGQFLEQ